VRLDPKSDPEAVKKFPDPAIKVRDPDSNIDQAKFLPRKYQTILPDFWRSLLIFCFNIIML
jgi:hypothetical protein